MVCGLPGQTKERRVEEIEKLSQEKAANDIDKILKKVCQNIGWKYAGVVKNPVFEKDKPLKG